MTQQIKKGPTPDLKILYFFQLQTSLQSLEGRPDLILNRFYRDVEFLGYFLLLQSFYPMEQQNFPATIGQTIDATVEGNPKLFRFDPGVFIRQGGLLVAFS